LKFGYAKKVLFRTFFSLAQRKEGKRKRAQHPLFGKAMTLAA
jgi:hypothetical protein